MVAHVSYRVRGELEVEIWRRVTQFILFIWNTEILLLTYDLFLSFTGLFGI